MAEDKANISIILATYNEIDNLPELVSRIENSVTVPYEIIFVDDGSKDGTREFIKDYCSNHNAKYIFSNKKRGTLLARYKGILISNSRYLLIMDSDLQHPPEKIVDMYQKLEEGYDFVSASRYMAGGSPGDRKALRGVISRGATFMARHFLQSANQLSDPLSNFIAFRRELKVQIFDNWVGYEIPMLIMSSNAEIRIAEIPFQFKERERGESKLTKTPAFFLLYLMELIRCRKLESIVRRR
ncbi:MAG: glycosyltransferase [Candidatus Thermoplasmatota archaeon]|nr:glycosyltransferase [Candidatus Thermoplasmatota archaeon]MCL5989116.1 glycosyltransferase [Candidatus Thermoplasmatota archaeon]